MARPADGLGAVVESYAVRAGAQNDDAQDGGAVSALLIGLLAAGEIDGALVSKPSADPDEQWKGIATIATTADEVRAASGSFYNQTMALAELDLSRYALPPKPRIAVVGTPCEVQGLRAMQARRWPTGAHRVDAVVLPIALDVHEELRLRGAHDARAARQARRRPRPRLEDGRDPRADDRRVPRRRARGRRAGEGLPRRRAQGLRRVRRLPRPLGATSRSAASDR